MTNSRQWNLTNVTVVAGLSPSFFIPRFAPSNHGLFCSLLAETKAAYLTINIIYSNMRKHILPPWGYNPLTKIKAANTRGSRGSWVYVDESGKKKRSQAKEEDHGRN